MKKLLVIAIAVFFLAGCAATLESVSLDGATLTLKNYVVTDSTYDKDGKITSTRTMLPNESVVKGSMDKIIDGIQGIVDAVRPK